MKRVLIIAGVTLAVLLATGVAVLPQAEATTPARRVQQLRVQVLEERPHDPQAFTQGLEIADGTLYESTGLQGESTIRATDPVTGAVRRKADLPAKLFGEGMTVVGTRIWQLTWVDQKALLWDRDSLVMVGEATYAGEGWGLCFDGRRLIMSNGSDQLTFRDPRTFAQLGQVTVRVDGVPVTNLNELECTSTGIWANIWQTERIVRIDPDKGLVTAVVDASGLHRSADRNAVLNGIAAVPGTREFLITGKDWPKTFRVRFVPAGR